MGWAMDGPVVVGCVDCGGSRGLVQLGKGQACARAWRGRGRGRAVSSGLACMPSEHQTVNGTRTSSPTDSLWALRLDPWRQSTQQLVQVLALNTTHHHHTKLTQLVLLTRGSGAGVQQQQQQATRATHTVMTIILAHRVILTLAPL